MVSWRHAEQKYEIFDDICTICLRLSRLVKHMNILERCQDWRIEQLAYREKSEEWSKWTGFADADNNAREKVDLIVEAVGYAWRTFVACDVKLLSVDRRHCIDQEGIGESTPVVVCCKHLENIIRLWWHRDCSCSCGLQCVCCVVMVTWARSIAGGTNVLEGTNTCKVVSCMD